MFLPTAHSLHLFPQILHNIHYCTIFHSLALGLGDQHVVWRVCISTRDNLFHSIATECFHVCLNSFIIWNKSFFPTIYVKFSTGRFVGDTTGDVSIMKLEKEPCRIVPTNYTVPFANSHGETIQSFSCLKSRTKVLQAYNLMIIMTFIREPIWWECCDSYFASTNGWK